jgi:S1-C subfamily serine protease
MLPAIAEQRDTAPETLAGRYASITGSMALVAYTRDKMLVTGSSFCVADKDGKSYFLTDAHVVGEQHVVSVFVSSDPGEALVGTVVRVNRALDAALIAIPGDVRPLTLSADRLPEGQKIAIAGYPSTHVRLALAGFGLAPSVHEGTISSYRTDAHWLKFDAQVERGNSGGPVFDPDTGRVYGLVTFRVATDQTTSRYGQIASSPFSGVPA